MKILKNISAVLLLSGALALPQLSMDALMSPAWAMALLENPVQDKGGQEPIPAARLSVVSAADNMQNDEPDSLAWAIQQHRITHKSVSLSGRLLPIDDSSAEAVADGCMIVLAGGQP